MIIINMINKSQIIFNIESGIMMNLVFSIELKNFINILDKIFLFYAKINF